MKKKIIFFFIVYSFFTTSLFSNEFKILVSINNSIITNYDLFLETKLIEYLDKKKINNNEKKIILNNIIKDKIKKLELEKYNININNSEIATKVNNLITENNLKILKDRLKEKITINSKWDQLILIKFRNKLEINMKEINKKVSNSDYTIDQIIKFEKEKKFNTISLNYFNNIKQNYLVKKL